MNANLANKAIYLPTPHHVSIHKKNSARKAHGRIFPTESAQIAIEPVWNALAQVIFNVRPAPDLIISIMQMLNVTLVQQPAHFAHLNPFVRNAILVINNFL